MKLIIIYIFTFLLAIFITMPKNKYQQGVQVSFINITKNLFFTSNEYEKMLLELSEPKTELDYRVYKFSNKYIINLFSSEKPDLLSSVDALVKEVGLKISKNLDEYNQVKFKLEGVINSTELNDPTYFILKKNYQEYYPLNKKYKLEEIAKLGKTKVPGNIQPNVIVSIVFSAIFSVFITLSFWLYKRKKI